MITTIPSQTSEMTTVDAPEQDKTKVQKTMVKESLTRAFDELHSGRVHHDARKLFAE